jgi:hypothetical protein
MLSHATFTEILPGEFVKVWPRRHEGKKKGRGMDSNLRNYQTGFTGFSG